MYAIVAVGGHQYRVAPEDSLVVPRLPQAVGEKIALGEVLLVSEKGRVAVGRATVEGARVEAEIVGHERGPKVRVFKIKRRKNYRRLHGHRQPLTHVRILSVVGGAGEETAEA